MSSIADFIKNHCQPRFPDGMPVDERDIRCNLYDCTWGMGLAGRGFCRHGIPTDPNCRGFELFVDYEEEPAPSPETEGKEK